MKFSCILTPQGGRVLCSTLELTTGSLKHKTASGKIAAGLYVWEEGGERVNVLEQCRSFQFQGQSDLQRGSHPWLYT